MIRLMLSNVLVLAVGRMCARAMPARRSTSRTAGAGRTTTRLPCRSPSRTRPAWRWRSVSADCACCYAMRMKRLHRSHRPQREQPVLGGWGSRARGGDHRRRHGTPDDARAGRSRAGAPHRPLRTLRAIHGRARRRAPGAHPQPCRPCERHRAAIARARGAGSEPITSRAHVIRRKETGAPAAPRYPAAGVHRRGTDRPVAARGPCGRQCRLGPAVPAAFTQTSRVCSRCSAAKPGRCPYPAPSSASRSATAASCRPAWSMAACCCWAMGRA